MKSQFPSPVAFLLLPLLGGGGGDTGGTTYEVSDGYGAPSYGAPAPSYGAPAYSEPSSGYEEPSSGYDAPSTGYDSLSRYDSRSLNTEVTHPLIADTANHDPSSGTCVPCRRPSPAQRSSPASR